MVGSLPKERQRKQRFVADRTRRVVVEQQQQKGSVEVLVQRQLLQKCKVNAQDADGLGAETGREEEQQLVLAPVI